jgi:hypothetical protein
MSPNRQIRGGKVIAIDNLYTVILALAFCVVFATAAFVAFKCYLQYETIFNIP